MICIERQDFIKGEQITHASSPERQRAILASNRDRNRRSARLITHITTIREMEVHCVREQTPGVTCATSAPHRESKLSQPRAKH
jgi:hypothetical protein